jgi:von Willebrand factor type A domain-containing protein
MLDLYLSFDTTGSMGPCIHQVRQEVSGFIDTLFREVDDLRIGLVAHGDYCDAGSYYVTAHHELSSNKESLKGFVRTVGRTGGGDSDECYELVMKEVARVNWRSEANKVFVLIADADPHEVGYRYGSFVVRDDWRDVAKDLVSRGIAIYPVQCLGDRSRKDFYNTLARISGTPRLLLAQFSNIVKLITAIAYKQESDEKLQEYGQQLQDTGQLDRPLATALNLLLNAKELIGGLEYTEEEGDLKKVDPWRFQMLHVPSDMSIMDFVNSTGAEFHKGKGFYELTKRELIQEHKEIVLRDSKGDMFTGAKAREMIGLPYGERGNVYPPSALDYIVFVQSTSNNRKLIGGTRFLYEVA